MYAFGVTVSIVAFRPIDSAAAAVACAMTAKSLLIGAVASTISSPVAPASSMSCFAASTSYGYSSSPSKASARPCSLAPTHTDSVVSAFVTSP